MSYRDDLTAAYAKIDSLERENKKLRDRIATPSTSTPAPAVEKFESMFGPDDSVPFLAALRRPLVKPLRAGAVRWVPIVFSISGEAGELKSVQVPNQWGTMRGEEFFACDNSSKPGHGTRITSIFIGSINQLTQFSNGSLGLPTWLFYEWMAPEDRATFEKLATLVGTKDETEEARSAAASLRIANAASKMKWSTWSPGIPGTFQIKFEETCRWDGVLWGSELL